MPIRTPSRLYISGIGSSVSPAANRALLINPCSPSRTIQEKVRTMMLVK